jgi:hypothetical protein
MVVVLVTSTAVPLVHTVDRHEVDAHGPVLVLHDAGQHRIAADPRANTDTAQEHCAACHLAGAFSPPGLESTGTPALRAGMQVAHGTTRVALSQLDLRVPARAPPARV